MLSNFITSNLENIVIGFALILIILVIALILLLNKYKQLNNRINVLENFDSVIDLLKANNKVETVRETDNTNEIDTTSLKNKVEMYKRLSRGGSLTKEEFESLNSD